MRPGFFVVELCTYDVYIYVHNWSFTLDRDSRKIIARLKSDGWDEIGVTGSHHHFKHSSKAGKVTVPHPKKDLPIGTLRSIEKQAGVKVTR